MQRSLLRASTPAPKKLAVILASLGMLTALPAAATLVEDGLSAAGMAQANGNAVQLAGPDTTLPHASAYATDSGGGSSANGSAWGHANGPYRASADGIGAFDSTGHFIRSWDITNDSGVAQHYAFNFYIYYGRIYTEQGIGGNGYAEYAVNISRDGSSTLFESSAKIESNGTLTTGGTALDSASHSGSPNRMATNAELSTTIVSAAVRPHQARESQPRGAHRARADERRARQSRGYEPAAGRRQTGWQEGSATHRVEG